jgi:hypothetical protein
MIYQAKKLLIIGIVLLLIGVVGPLLMILDIIPTSFLLGFLLHAASVSGLLLGTLGAFSYARPDKK